VARKLFVVEEMGKGKERKQLREKRDDPNKVMEI